jgi:nucleotide-binding universal stress UspA family protein
MLQETPREPQGQSTQRALRALEDDFGSRYRLPAVQVRGQIGRVAAEIIEVAQKTGPRLIIIGGQGEGLAKDLELGGTAMKVLHGSSWPVLVADVSRSGPIAASL